MKKFFVVAVTVIVVLSISSAVFAQDNAFAEDGWKKRFASPSYGLSLMMLNVSDDNGLEETILVPGFDFRILNGTNISKRGGFYTGYEVGATIYHLGESDSFYISDASMDAHVAELFAGCVYIMQKYGYRLDLGAKAGGISIGTEIGIGIQVGGGDYEVVDDSDEDNTISGETDNPLGMLLELTLEGSLRMGQNKRLFAGLGVMVSNPMLDEFDGGFGSLDVEQNPVRPVLRGGFSMNY
ncbi:hypothetical protein [Marispirochaeta aestuarii]|uniref:hypothetical protein n=1 Tax=Marispirochaeta aestuarii TaxID=1963862 RepID=UPI002ABDB611|nr:hypothetical protein [Marispirochaeta aestuarii]